ncbi:MAG: TonB-dependent receptor, partial [Exilibacterium sp.]
QAVFGQMTYDLTAQLSLTLGLRWTEENKAFKPLQFTESLYVFPVSAAETDGAGGYVHPFDGNVYPTLGGAGAAAIVPGGTLLFLPQWNEESYSDTTPMLNLAYQLNDDVMVYTSYSEGFKSGGFNARNIKPAAAIRAFEPETAKTVEMGIKADLFDNTLRINGAIFTTDYEDLQFVIREDFAPIVFYAGEAQIDGAELEWTWVPNAAVQVVGGIGQCRSGVLTPRLDWSYRDDVVFDVLNSEEIAQEAYDIVNASIIWDSPAEKWRVAASVNNLTDELYRLAGNTAIREASSYSETTYARGREWTLSVRRHF